MLKRILIGSGLVVVMAGLTLGVLSLLKHQEAAPITQTPLSKKLVLDHSKDYGACTLLDASTIKAALGSTAANLQNSVDAGNTSDRYFGDGVKNITSESQTCVYAFAPGSTTDELINGTNGLTIKRTTYTNAGGPTALIEQTKHNPTVVTINSLGDAAFYITEAGVAGPNPTSSFTLLVFKNNQSTSYGIIQPAAATTFTADSAKVALLRLAEYIKPRS